MERTWEVTRRLVAEPADLVVSFKLDGKTIAGIPADWKPSTLSRRIDAAIVETVHEGREPRTGLVLRVECLAYEDYPVVEWTAWLSNEGNRATPILSDILAIDAVFEGAEPVLWHGNGDFCSRDGYSFADSPVRTGEVFAFSPTGGRACDRAFPYYRLAFSGGGLSIAIGWPAQWSASFVGAAGGVQVKAGQEVTHLSLMPGETIRTPRMTVMSWTGDSRHAVNLWRRWYRAHLLPRPDGRPLRPMLAGHGTDEGEEFTEATEENQLRFIDRWQEHGIELDIWWIDAGWYPCRDPDDPQKRSWPATGTWVPDPERFPRGLKPVSDRASRDGADLLLWFEPERLTPGTQLDLEHPAWTLKIEKDENRLLNLGDPACRRWLTDHVCGLIRDNGIRIYRQDHNFAPLEFWRANEADGRRGMRENLHVQGYLRYWDDLLARNPGLWIDSCASGGRRNDLETLRRSVPLHYSDFGYGDHAVKLSFHHVLFEWMPYFKESTLSWDVEGPKRYDRGVDGFSYHCALAPMLMPTIDIQRDDYDFELMKRLVAIWRRAADLVLDGDYYPLTPIHRSADQWVALQFDCPEENRGFLQGIRLQSCPAETLVVRPQAIMPDRTYVFENPETGERRELSSGMLLRDGFTFRLAVREGSIWFYTTTTR